MSTISRSERVLNTEGLRRWVGKGQSTVSGPGSGASAETSGKLRIQRRRHHFAIAADKDDVIVFHHDVERAVMQQPVMGAAQKH